LARLTLFVAGRSPNSQRALTNLADVGVGPDHPALEVVDVLASPARAMDEGVLLTPSLVIERDDERLVLVGGLDDRSVLKESLASLDLVS